MKASQQKLPEHFHDDRGVQRRKRQKLSFRSENSIGDDCVAMRLEITAEGPERLQRNDTSRTNVAALEQGLEGLADGIVGGA
jgi:hypothetical protein